MPKSLTASVSSITRKARGKGRKLAVLGLSLLGFSGGAMAAGDKTYVDLFYKQGYGYCDARKLAKVFRSSPYRAKVIAGQKIALGYASQLGEAWRIGQQRFAQARMRCGRSSLPDEHRKFAYNDADRIAAAWGRDGRRD